MQEGQGEAPAETGGGATPYEAVRADARYQFEPEGLPVIEPRPEQEPSPFWEFIRDVLSAVLPFVFWGGLAAFGLFVLYHAARFAQARWKDRARDEAPEPAPYAPAPAAVRTLLDDAARLAAEGRYGDAVRLLLRRSIEDVERRHPGAVRDSLTSREIAGLGVLTALTREAFGGLAALVEAAHFAERKLGQSDWEAARALYERLGQPGPPAQGAA